jgi:hypothetical protein
MLFEFPMTGVLPYRQSHLTAQPLLHPAAMVQQAFVGGLMFERRAGSSSSRWHTVTGVAHEHHS